MADFRTERDTMGEISVPEDAYWGAQTQRAIENFSIGSEAMPFEVIHAYARLKKACAQANHHFGIISERQLEGIEKACDAIESGELDDQFPLVIWQTGSGTQTHMNVNEVIANYANNIFDLGPDDEDWIHPNDHVNASQSSNDTFPSVMHMALSQSLIQELIPTLVDLRQQLEDNISSFEGIVRIGRTHLQDAVPISIGQSFSAYHTLISESINHLIETLEDLYELPIGATAVGTGLNAPEGFSTTVTKNLANSTNIPFRISKNNFASLSAHHAIQTASGHMASLATHLTKMANDIRLLGSGPRCGLGELRLPKNEPGSSIMPGKVNPTQCEALAMICLQVMANHQLILMAGANGHFELNTYKPLIIYAALQSCHLLTDISDSFRKHVLADLQLHEEKIAENLENSLMLITALKPIIGYDDCARIANYAHENNLTLREAALDLELVSEEVFDEHINPRKMV